MDFAPSDERRMLGDTLGRYLATHYGFATRQKIAGSPEGFSREAWGAMAELGMIGALFGEEAGGYGGAGFDIATVFEAIGRAIVVEPFLGTLMAARLLTQACHHDGLVTDMMAGSRIATAALYEAQGRYDYANVIARAEPDGVGWRLTGTKAVVPQIEAADVLIVSARTAGCPGRPDGLSLFAVPRTARGIAVRGYSMIDGGRGGEVALRDVGLDGTALVGREGEALPLIERAVAAGIVALSYEAVGALAVVRDATLEHLRTRVQFGAPIGRSQVLQHRMATVEIEIEQARSAAFNAAAALEGDRHARERAASAAKYTIGRVGTLVAEEAIQMHGGIGMTWDLPLSHYAKRLVMIDHQLGDEDFHLQRYIDLGNAGPPAATPEDSAEA